MEEKSAALEKETQERISLENKYLALEQETLQLRQTLMLHNDDNHGKRSNVIWKNLKFINQFICVPILMARSNDFPSFSLSILCPLFH